MKVSTTAVTTALLLLSATIVSASPLQDKQGEKRDKPGNQEQHAQKPPQQHQEQHAKQPQQHAQTPPQQRQEQHAKQPQQHTQKPPQQRQEQHGNQDRDVKHQQARQQQQSQQSHQQQQKAPQRVQPQQQPVRHAGARPQGHPQRPRQEAVAWQQRQGWRQPNGWQGHDSWQQSRANRWDNDHRSWAQRGGYGGYYMPQATFNLNFGSQHYFRLGGRPVMYMGYPRFAYGGYSFLMVDPWPEQWDENWYGTDDVYVDYSDGYYLYDRKHPGIALAISILL